MCDAHKRTSSARGVRRNHARECSRNRRDRRRPYLHRRAHAFRHRARHFHAGGIAIAARAGMPDSSAFTIAIVDDDAAIRRLVRLVLTRAGFDSFECTTGEEARAALTSRPWDLAIL